MIGRVLRGLDRIENLTMAALALVLILGAAMQVILRLFDSGLLWLDPVLRALVMWIAMLGALAAARHDKHINLDALTRVLSPPWRRVARIITLLFAAVICGVLANASVGLVAMDRESATLLVDHVPAWWTEVILPIGFGLMALRFTLRAFVAPPTPEAEPVP